MKRQPAVENERLRRALLRDPQHVGVDVDEGHGRQRAARLRHPYRDVAGAASDVNMCERARQRRADLGDESILPRAVEARTT